MKAIMAHFDQMGNNQTLGEAVARVLPSNKFLQNVGLKSVAFKRTLLLQHVYKSWCSTWINFMAIILLLVGPSNDLDM
jgi:thiaminase